MYLISSPSTPRKSVPGCGSQPFVVNVAVHVGDGDGEPAPAQQQCKCGTDRPAADDDGVMKISCTRHSRYGSGHSRLTSSGFAAEGNRR
jgi:hypothetical protein